MKAYYNEIDPFAAQWLRNLIVRNLIAPGDVDERDIRKVSSDDLKGYTQCHFFAGIGGWSYALRLAGWPDDKPVWTGSCPCQPFSVAGARKGVSDERHLWPAFFALIRECVPPVLFGEQVASKAGLEWFDLVSDDLEGAGYAVGAADLCAASVGAPHIRQRLWFVGNSRRNGSGRNARAVSKEKVGIEREVRGLVDGFEPSSATGELANFNGRHSSSEREQRGREYRQQSENGLVGEEVLADTVRTERERDREERRRRAEPANDGRSFWSDCDWISCTDGNARPVEPGTFPLAYGIPQRVGRLRAYGNAIIPQVAATFIDMFVNPLD